ncbi:ileal sodium/bile acid cotransporter-like protein 1 [Sarcoptes scabiei]|uniref:Ileal sodium/bile acid cotransporter-like protein 1 n=1 Tax=Sarcoptes scabiei TaxID=52283 RepID=A0A131ZZU8_SARSC|nr:ileal sodium/bile acid cotransporter-like protein 1 [Sarcoptes scabiei]
MGCALDMDAVFQVLRRPIAPAIGIFSQYVCMPLIAFALASFFLDETYLKLGIFIFGCSPGGGASNMWTVLVKGNLNLSIAMTFLSTLLSIGFMPIWLYTLGRTIFEGTTTSPPFRNIFTTLASMIARRILAPFSGMMIIFIIVFGTYSNFYMFRVMNFKMIFAAAINVWCGMFLGFTLAYLFRKPMSDMLTIAIETGVQNTGVSIVVLGLSLKQPDADLASAVPVAASLMTPIPLTIAWLIVRLNEKFFHCQKDCPEY